MSIFHEIQMAVFQYDVTLQSHVDMLLVLHVLCLSCDLDPVQGSGHLAKPCMLAAMTAAPLLSFLVIYINLLFVHEPCPCSPMVKPLGCHVQ